MSLTSADSRHMQHDCDSLAPDCPIFLLRDHFTWQFTSNLNISRTEIYRLFSLGSLEEMFEGEKENKKPINNRI